MFYSDATFFLYLNSGLVNGFPGEEPIVSLCGGVKMTGGFRHPLEAVNYGSGDTPEC